MADGAETLVVVPQHEELAPLLAAFECHGHVPRSLRLGRLECVTLPGLHIVLAVGGHGKAQLAVQTQHLIEQCASLGAVICCGAAGRLVDHVSLGDVVVATRCIEHDYRLRFVRRPAPSHQAHEPSVNRMRDVLGGLQADFMVHFGPIASGDEDIVDLVRARELQEETGALCVAWEGAGAARAAAFSRLPFLEVRAITDAADERASADFRANLRRAMPNLAQVLLRWPLIAPALVTGANKESVEPWISN